MYITRKLGSFDVGIELTDEEILKAYATYQQIKDKENIENYLEDDREYYNALYKIYKNPVTDKEIKQMTIYLREYFDNNVGRVQSVCIQKAIEDVLKERELF